MRAKRHQFLLTGVAQLLSAAACGLALSSGAVAAGLEDAITSIVKPSASQKAFLAVVDVKTERGADEVSSAVLNAVQRYASGAALNQKIPPAVSPATPARMRLSSSGAHQVPQCDGDVANVVALDVSMARYGEATGTVVCIFPYRGGFQVNYFASFSQRSGGMNTNILGAMLGRVITNAFGIGDSSTFVGKTIEAMQEKLADAGMKGTLVELFPSIPGLEVVRDNTPRAVSGAAIASAEALSGPTVEASGPDAALMPVHAKGLAAAPAFAPGVPASGIAGAADYQDAANAMAEVRRRMEEARAVYASQVGSTIEPSPLQARKELAAMGLSYFDGTQFLAAIRRGDVLAVRLYVSAQGVDLQQPGSDGLTPLQAAQQNEKRPEVLSLLRAAGAQ
jgi:hypothetical protein